MRFSRRVEADFQKTSKNFIDLFRSTKLNYQALPKHLQEPVLAKFCAPQANFWRNSPKTAFEETVLKVHQKIAFFFGARSPLKISFYRRQRPKGPSTSMDISKQYEGGTLWVSRGRIPEKRLSQLL